jgi:hypothetical protein
MRGLTDFLITVYVMKGLLGRGPVLVGLWIVLAIPLGVLLVLIEGLYPGGLPVLAGRIFRAVILGLH